jgi:DNA-binding transcriptional LysR family regulator
MFRDAFPQVEIALQPEMMTSHQVPALVEGRLDVGLLRPPVAVDGWSVEVIDQEPMLALIPDSHPAAGEEVIELRDLRRDRFVMFRGSSDSRVNQVVTSACRSAGFDPVVGQNVSMTAAVVGLVSAGLGVALVPRSVQQVRAEGVVYVRIHDAPIIELAICWRSGSAPTSERFVRFVLERTNRRDSDEGES